MKGGPSRSAARFFDRSEASKTFKRGMDAHNNPGFYRQQIEVDPTQPRILLTELGVGYRLVSSDLAATAGV
jgi:hypothetical protein